MKDIFANIRRNALNITVLTMCVYMCYHMAIGGKPSMAIVVGLLPACILGMFACVRWPKYLLAIVFVFNYGIMGLTRYTNIPFPITIMFEMLCMVILVCFLMRMHNQRIDLVGSANLYWLLMFLWFAYCMINVGNGITGRLRAEDWYRAVRPIGVYPLLVSVVIAFHAKRYTFIRGFLILWGILNLLAVAKGYYQRNVGFDHYEWAWLWAGGAKTHLISTGVRYFSFFTDAANFGCGMGMSLVVFAISAYYTSNFKCRIYYYIVAIACGYGMLISGTRAAIAVPIVGLAMFTVLCKNWKIFVTSLTALCLGVFILAFTKLGDNQPLVHRMRTAFDKDDASMNVRIENQRAIKAYMAETPFGIGLGIDWMNLSTKNKYYIVAATPPDSDWVNIWIRTGQVGLTIYLIIQAFVLILGSYIVLFRIKRNEIRGPLIGMLCGSGGLLIASYANMVYFQFPNGPITYTCLTLVFLGKKFEQQYIEDHENAEA